MKKLIVIADWAADSMNYQEFRSAVEGYLKEPDSININYVESDPHTLHTGYVLAQVVLTEERLGRPSQTVIFQNTDPRLQTTEGVEQAKGAEFILIKLKSGLWVCGPNAGYDFSFIKHKIEELFHYDELDKGSQFRSRDLYARISAHLMEGMEDEMDLSEMQSNVIPEIRGYYVGHVDNHGNIKTTITHEELKGKFEYGEEVTVTLNKITKKAKYATNLFGAGPGTLVIYPGSSGVLDNPYLEISVWRHFTEADPTTGVHAFNNPKPGMEIKIRQK